MYHRPAQFQPKASIPMVRETHSRLALQLRLAGESLIGQPTVDSYNTLSKMLAALNRAGLAATVTDPATDTMNAICDRFVFEPAGGVTVKEAEAETLRASLAAIDAALPRVPVNRFAHAVAEVEAFFALTEAAT